MITPEQLESIREYAVKCHAETNHKYDHYLPYEYHLRMVVNTAIKFKHLVPAEDFGLVHGGCWTHDVIEDCRQTFNDVKEACGEQVAELAYALTNEKGRNRKERGNDKYYANIRDTKYAVFIKLCDRIANVEYSKMSGSRMLEMYQRENVGFIEKLWDEQYAKMFDYLTKLF